MRHERAHSLSRFDRHRRARACAAALGLEADSPRPLPTDIDRSRVPAYALEALSVLGDAGKQGFLVGGFVRDALRGAPAHDVDMTTDALWYQTRDIFMERGYRVVETGAKHGTVTVFVDGRPIEITTFRTEGAYSDHRRPDSVRYVRNVEEDLARRDFTVNAMAWSPATGLVDPFGGREDLAEGVVRAVGEARLRFEEDALRVMRGVRFAAKLGFGVEEETDRAIHGCVGELTHVARERIATEFDGIVRGPGAVDALRAYPDVAAAAVPAVAAMVGFDQHSKWHAYDVWEHCLHALELLDERASSLVRHVVLLHDIGKPPTFTMGADGRGHFYGHEEQGARMLRRALENLRWKASDVDRACCLVRLHDHRIDPTPRGVRRVLARIGSSFPGAQEDAAGIFADLLLVKRADTLAHAPGCVARRLREIERVDEAFRTVIAEGQAFCLRDLAVDGRDLMDAGFVAGPELGRALKVLLGLVVDGELANERGELLDAAMRMAAVQGHTRSHHNPHA